MFVIIRFQSARPVIIGYPSREGTLSFQKLYLLIPNSLQLEKCIKILRLSDLFLTGKSVHFGQTDQKTEEFSFSFDVCKHKLQM